MRRAAASVLVTLGLLSAGVAWWALAARVTVLDPDRSARIADTLIDQAVIRDAVAEGLGTALLRALPPGTPIDPLEIEAAAQRALDDPRTQNALRTTVLSSHQRMIGHYDGPVTVDVTPIGAAGRDALIAARPELAHALPEAPSLSIDLPTSKLPRMAWLPERTRELGALALFLAVTFLGLGLLASSDRPGVLSRAGRWALRAGVFWFAFGWALPWAMTKIDEPRLAAFGALGVATVGPMIAPAVLLVCTGIGALLGARAWRLALAALPSAPPSGGPGRPRPAPGPAWPDSSGPGSWDPIPSLPRYRAPRRGRDRVPTPTGATDPYDRPDPPGERSTRTWRA